MSEQEREPQDASDPAEHDPEITTARPDPGRPWGVLAVVITIVVLALIALFASRCDSNSPEDPPSPSASDDSELVARPDHLRTRELNGLVLRELPLAEGETPTAGKTRSSEPVLTDEPAFDELLAALEPTTLSAPPPGSCRVQAWQGNDRVGPEVVCEPDGSYRLAIGAEIRGVVAVELLIEGHLRGLVEVDIDAALAESTDASSDAISLATVALGPGHRVAGQTIDARGEPLAGVHVQALPQPNLGETVPWRTVSDAEGRFEFTTLPYGPANLRGIKPGFALSVVEAIAPEDSVLMVLEALIDLEGDVVGDPALLARAVVRLEGSSVWPAIEIGVGEDGSFVFEDLPDGVYGVEVTVPAEAPGGPEWASVPLENITPDLHVAVALVPAFRVPVRVVDPDGEPVLGARVTLGYSSIGMLQKVAETDDEGRVRVGPVVPGPYFVHADADGFLAPEPVEVEIAPEGYDGDEQVLVLIRPATLEGVVVDEDDRPVAGAEVWLDSEVAFSVGEEASRRQLFSVAIGASEGSLGVTRGQVPDIPLFADDAEGEGTTLGSVVTDEDGRFELDLLLPGTHRIWATHGGHAASAVQNFELKSGEVRGGVRLRLREGVPLTGVVRSGNGQPIAGVQVDLGDGLVLTTDERGVFDAGHRRGRQTLTLRGPGLIPKQVEVDLGNAKGGRGGLDLDVELEPARGQFEGRVVDGNGQPIANVEVELRPLDGLGAARMTWTDERGIYQFDELAPGPVELGFEHLAYVAAEDRVRVDEQPGLRHEIVLDTGWSAIVVVRSSGRGDPIAGAEVRAKRAKQVRMASADKQGQARLDRLVGDAVEINVEAPGWVAQHLTLRREGEVTEVELIVELVEGGSISGTVDDDIGDPVSSASIEIRDSAGVVLGQTRSDGRGQWRVDGIRAGDVVVRASPPSALSAVLAPVRVDSDIRRAELTTDVRLRFDKL